jgi:hypothetical protein
MLTPVRHVFQWEPGEPVEMAISTRKVEFTRNWEHGGSDFIVWNRDMTAVWDVLKQQRWMKKHEEPFEKRSHRWHLKHLLESNAITVVSLTLGTEPPPVL